MSANQEAKKLVVEQIKQKIQDSKSVVLVKFNGLSVAEDTELRREFRKNKKDKAPRYAHDERTVLEMRVFGQSGNGLVARFLCEDDRPSRARC